LLGAPFTTRDADAVVDLYNDDDDDIDVDVMSEDFDDDIGCCGG
jgi:hypothetical protein